jgi:AAA15 family ATPase/GTPase
LNAGGRLMIDEIDTGIHYSRFREFWKVILKSAHQNHVQLFMTTHNEECIKYFKEVLEDEVPDLQKEARSIVLVEKPTTKQVTSITYSFEEFEHALNVGNEIRG